MRLIDADALASALNNGRLEEQTGRAVPFNAGVAFALTMVEYAPTIEPKRGEWIDAVPVVRCKDCKWYDPPHIDHGGGKRTDVEDGDPPVPLSVGINVGGKCMNTLREYCCNHDREDPDDYERLVKFRNRMDYCSDGERKDDE